MDALRKIGSVVLMVLTVIGFLVALGGCIGAWSYKDDVTTAVTSGLDAAIKVATLGERAMAQSSVAVGQVSAGLSAAQEGLGERVAGRQENIANLKAAASERYGPTVNRAVETVSATTDAIVAFNTTLESVNRIPGVTVPTFTAELETAQAQIDALAERVGAIQQTVADVLPDGTPIQDAVGSAAATASSAASALQDYSTRLGSAKEQATSLQSSAPSTINTLVWLLSLLLLLWAAGQVSLFFRALEWYQRPATQPA